MLIEEPSHKWLVTAAANSPENSFFLPDKTVHVAMGPTIVTCVLSYLSRSSGVESSKTLGIDPDFLAMS